MNILILIETVTYNLLLSCNPTKDKVYKDRTLYVFTILFDKYFVLLSF